MMKSITFAICLCLLVFGINRSGQAQGKVVRSSISPTERTTREQDGLNGPVRRVRVETAALLARDGKTVEAPRVLREVTTYDAKGLRIDSVAYPVESNILPGKEQYRYDDKGNIVEMVLRGDDGSILSKEEYEYQFDEFGNWKKMTSLVALYESGKLTYEPVEVTYRMISYYYNGAVDRLAGSQSKASDSSGSNPAVRLLPPEQPKAAPTQSSFTKPKTAIKRVGNSLSVNSKAKNGEIKDTASAAVAQRGSLAIQDSPIGSPIGTTVAAPSDPGNNAIPIKSLPEHKSVKLEEGTPVSNIVTQPGGSSAAELKPSTNRSTSFYETGLSYLRSGRHAEAVVAFRQAVLQNPNDAVAYTKLGLAYSGLHQYREAVTVLKMAISINPEAIAAEAYYQLGHAYTSMGKHSDALKAFTQALYVTRAQAKDPVGAKGQGFPLEQIHYSLGLAYHNLARYNEAIKELKQVIEVNPRNAEAYYLLALAYIAIGDQPSAENQQKTLRSLNPALAAKIAEALYSPPVRCSYVTGCR
jgi:Flp pilus assembly protein TadD